MKEGNKRSEVRGQRSEVRGLKFRISLVARGSKLIVNSSYLIPLFFFFLLLSVLCSASFAQTPQTKKQSVRILFVLDGSGSMKGEWENANKWNAAKDILTLMVDSLKRENIEFGLRVFGHQSERALEDCNDTKLEIPFVKNNYAQLSSKLNSISPKGHSPIALSLEKAVNDFPLNGDAKNIIILITDGFENCSGDACEAAQKLQNSGIFLRPYIVGLGLSAEQLANFDCVGEIYDVQEQTSISTISNVVITNVLNPTSLQINLLNEAGKPTETNVDMTFSESSSHQIKYNLIHTLNFSGNPDTLYIEPSRSYDVKVHTIPPVYAKNIQLNIGKHTIKAIDAPQGSLKIVMNGSMKYKNLKCLVRRSGSSTILNAQDASVTQNYITGTYDLEILTLPRTVLNEVPVSQSQTKSITVPPPGSLNIVKTKPGLLTIFKNADGIMEKIYVMDAGINKESIMIQPGTYEVTYRLKNAQTTKSTITKKITVTAGTVATITF
jgi:Ca-activated chloride channel homolog